MDKKLQIEVLDDLYDRFNHLHEEFALFWLDHIFLHWDWWIGILISVGPWIFWIFYRKKESTHRLLYAGIFVIAISFVMCYVGSALGLWYYTGKVIPVFPGWAPYHACLLPVTIMFFIQTKPHIAPWKKGIVFGLLTAFVAEPILVWTGYYVMTGWQYIYSAPIYPLIFIFCDWLTKRNSFEKVLNT